ncbi:MAG: glycosyltransferase family 4 protein [Deltaproteobacteria bacterium]|nr:glycosyltransferase family 4 protein [Deltaproteobacteria bacterium]
MTNLNVLMVLPEFFPVMGGTEIQALHLSKALRKMNVEVAVLTRMSTRELRKDEVVDGLDVHRVDYPRISLIGGLMLNLGYSWNLIRNRGTRNIVHFHIGGTHMLLPLLVSKFLGKPTLLKISGWWEMDRGFLKPDGFYPSLMRNILFASDRIIAVSDEIRKRLVELGYPGDRIVRFPNGVDTARYYPDPEGREKRRYRLVFAGRLVKEKGIGFLLEALKSLRSEFPDITLDIVGSGREERNMMDLARTMDLADCVSFLGKRDDVGDVLRKAGIYIQPSVSEGLPNSLLEAMACGLPVIVTNVGGMPDVVEDGRNGFVVRAGDAGSLTDAIRAMIRDPASMKIFSANNVELIRNNYSLDSVAGQYANLYREVLEK